MFCAVCFDMLGVFSVPFTGFVSTEQCSTSRFNALQICKPRACCICDIENAVVSRVFVCSWNLNCAQLCYLGSTVCSEGHDVLLRCYSGFGFPSLSNFSGKIMRKMWTGSMFVCAPVSTLQRSLIGRLPFCFMFSDAKTSAQVSLVEPMLLMLIVPIVRNSSGLSSYS